MNIGIFGSGYVGLVAAACFAEMGNKVICLDINKKKINDLKNGIVPIYEPGLNSLVKNNLERETLFFTTNIKELIATSDIVFIAVGTPMGEDGSADLSYDLQVAEQIGKEMIRNLIIVNKSTVPVGTADKVRVVIEEILAKKKLDIEFDVVSIPEFLKEGAAIQDFMHPDRVVVGSNNTESTNTMRTLYAPFTRTHDRFIDMNIRSAEMTKYAANAMLATKISFINEIANICEHVDADVNQVRIGIGSDARIGYKFIYPGCGYGGSCFPKDVKALINISETNGYTPELISSVESVNKQQKEILFKKVINYFGDNLKGKLFGIWGLAFKPETNDMREAPSINLIKSIINAGGQVNAYDPQSMDEAKFYFKDIKVNYCKDKYTTLKNADALILVTEWKESRSPDFNKIKKLMKGNLFIDGRNQFKNKYIESKGLKYIQIGLKA